MAAADLAENATFRSENLQDPVPVFLVTVCCPERHWEVGGENKFSLLSTLGLLAGLSFALAVVPCA